MEKYHKTDIAPIEQENERDENYLAYNPQIDCTRTRNNYNVFKRRCSYTQHINNRIAELDLPTKVRKDAVMMCSFVVGSDREFFKRLSAREQEKFFADCTRFFVDRYGEENIISAVVHMDETTPHMHLNLVPIVDRRLCAKELFTPKTLRELQSDFWEKVGKKWNLERGKPGSQAKHKSVAEYKAQKILESARNEAKNIISEADGKAQAAKLQADSIVSQAEQTAGAGLSERRDTIGGRRKNQTHAEETETSRGRNPSAARGKRRPAAGEKNRR